jgi:hypothetical protein
VQVVLPVVGDAFLVEGDGEADGVTSTVRQLAAPAVFVRGDSIVEFFLALESDGEDVVVGEELCESLVERLVLHEERDRSACLLQAVLGVFEFAVAVL